MAVVNVWKGTTLSFKAATVEYNTDVTSWVLKHDDAADAKVAFASAGQGPAQQWYFDVEFLQDLGPGSFWRYLYDNAGTTVAFVAVPYSNAGTGVSSSAPKWTGSVILDYPSEFGGDTQTTIGGEQQVATVRLNITPVGKPTMAFS